MSTILTASINSSPTISGKAASEITDVRCKAVKFDSNGKIVLASTEGENFVGVAIPTSGDANGKVLAGGDVDIQIKDIGLAIAGAAISAGAALMTDANGKVVTATAGKFIIGYALNAASADGDYISIQISKGYYPTAGAGSVSLNDLSDVVITSAQEGNVLAYDATASKWKNETLSLDDLSDVTIATPTASDSLTYDGTTSQWKNTAAGTE